MATLSEDALPRLEKLHALQVVYHPQPFFVGKRLVLEPNETITVGRGGYDLGPGGLDDSRISRRHTAFSLRGDQAIVRDLGSLNGTKLNDESVDESALQPGDLIAVGPLLFLYFRAPARACQTGDSGMVGVSVAMDRVLTSVELVAPHAATVLVMGESGTGKELVARAIHASSGRRGKLMLVNCGGMADTLLQSELFGHARGAFSGAEKPRPGLIEDAHNGTIFLDEIGDASAKLQTSLLRFLQEGEVRRLGSNQVRRVDTRVVAATHRDLRNMVADGTFREDLYARLSGWIIEVPPLRERCEDIVPLVQHFATRHSGPSRMARKLSARLMAYTWPRNVRELETIVKRAIIEAQGTDRLRLTPSLAASLSLDEAAARPAVARPSIKPLKRPQAPPDDELRDLVTQCGGNMRKVSKSLGVARTTAYRWIEAAGIDVAAVRAASSERTATVIQWEDPGQGD